VKYLSASILALAVAILIYALMPRYYLVVAFPREVPIVQIGPFATQAGCENARRRILDAILENSDMIGDKSADYDQAKKVISQLTVCVSSR
jgi:hypothetical protein